MRVLGKIALCAVLALGMVAGMGRAAEAQEVDAATLLATLEAQLTIDLEQAGPEPVEGAVQLRSNGDLTEVSIELSGVPAEAEISGYLRSGTCSDDGAVIAELGEIELDASGNGRLMAEVAVELESIAQRPVSVEVEGSEGRILACGEYEPVNEDEPAPAPTPDAIPAPAPDPLR